MTNEQAISESLQRLETQIAPIAASAASVRELRDELAPRVNEAVHALITELTDIEADFQIEDLLYLLKKAMRNVRNLDFALDQMKNIIDFVRIAEPLMKTSVPQIIFYLDGLDQSGVFRLVKVGIEVLKQIGADYSEEEIQQVGQGLVRLAGMLKKLTTPKSLELLERAADLPAGVDLSTARDVGPWGLLRVMGDPQVKRGMGVLMELTRGLSVLKEAPSETA
jgi:uncharacterized protein YjgD (DUF1641 family)